MATVHSADQPAFALPIVSSQTLGWTSLLMEEYRQSAGIAEFQPEAHPAIVVSLASQPRRIRQVMGDRRFTGLYRRGDLTVIPAGISSGYQTEGEDHHLYVQIPLPFLQRVAKEVLEIDSKQLELMPVFQVRNSDLEQILLLLRSELHRNGDLGRLYADSLANALAVNLLKNNSASQVRPATVQTGLGDRQLLKVTQYLHDALDQDIRLADLAHLIGISQSHFSRLFKQSTGLSPYQYLLQQRIDRAKELLKHTNQSLIEIALTCGFDSHSHLSRQFKQITGMTPKSYRSS